MFWIKIKRIFRSGFYSFWRNGFISASSIVVMVITLSVITSTIFIGAVLNSSLEQLRDQVDINVYFIQSAQPNDILSAQKSLQALPEVATVQYTSADQALAAFKIKHADDQLY